jgi:uncharacterized GH25 family protein
MKPLLVLTFTLLLAARLAAHEFWLWPEAFTAAPGTTVQIGLRVGENFSGEVRPFRADRAAAWRHTSTAGVTDLRPQLPAAPGREAFAVALAAPGTHVLTYDSQPSTIVLPPADFLSYLQEEGLDHVAAARHAAGQDQAPGRERYQRFVKTLLLAGAKADATFGVPTGQRLEIVPDTDPLAARAGGRLAFTVQFEGRPLPGASVRAWHRRGTAVDILKGQTGADGTVGFTLPDAGPWMISVVHMVPLRDVPGLDWESSWASLTFALAP